MNNFSHFKLLDKFLNFIAHFSQCTVQLASCHRAAVLARLVHLACKCARLQKSLSPGFIARCGACPKLLPPLPQATYVATDITYIFVFFFYFCVEAHLKCKTFETISTTAAAAAISWSKLEAVVVVRSYFLTPLEIRANVNEPNPHPPPRRGHDVACVWRVWRSARIGGWSLFVFCSLCVRVLKLNCFTRARRNSTFHSSLSFHSTLSPSLFLCLISCINFQCLLKRQMCLRFVWGRILLSLSFVFLCFFERVEAVERGGAREKVFLCRDNTIPSFAASFGVGRTRCNAVLQVSTLLPLHSLCLSLSLFLSYFWYFNKLSDNLMGSSWV